MTLVVVSRTDDREPREREFGGWGICPEHRDELQPEVNLSCNRDQIGSHNRLGSARACHRRVHCCCASCFPGASQQLRAAHSASRMHIVRRKQLAGLHEPTGKGCLCVPPSPVRASGLGFTIRIHTIRQRLFWRTENCHIKTRSTPERSRLQAQVLLGCAVSLAPTHEIAVPARSSAKGRSNLQPQRRIHSQRHTGQEDCIFGPAMRSVVAFPTEQRPLLRSDRSHRIPALREALSPAT
jgi:hypothetical protein